MACHAITAKPILQFIFRNQIICQVYFSDGLTRLADFSAFTKPVVLVF
jgi:hypothetical protein